MTKTNLTDMQMFAAGWILVAWAMTEQAGPGRADPVWEERVRVVAGNR